MGRSTGLVMLNPLMIGLGVFALLAALGWAIAMSLRGTIVVRVQWDADAKDELFSILISRSARTPSIENLTAYRKKMEWQGKRRRRFEAWNIDQNTTFRGIPRGKWHVHLYGIYTRGRQTMLLREPPQEVEVLARKTAFVAHALVSRALERQVDEASPYRTKAPRPLGTVAAATAAAATSATVFQATGTSENRPATSPPPDEHNAPAGIEIRLEDTPAVDLISPFSSALARTSALAAPAASLARTGRLTMNLKPLSPELSETILPASIASMSNPTQPSPQASTGTPERGTLEQPMTIGEEPLVDLGPPFEGEDNTKTDPTLARPTPSPPAKPKP